MTEVHCPKCDTPVEDGARFCANCGENLLEASAASDDPYVGRTINGFLIQQLIGIGAMGRVYRSEQLSLGKTVAVKILHRHLLGDPSLEKRFQREARAAAKLQHPNCISVIDFGKGADGSLFIAMEYLEGPSLGQILQDGPMPWPRAIRILEQVASALDEAHNEGIIHRDLKPENIVLEQRRKEEDFVKVLDFGIAKVQESDNREGQLTMVGAVCGTPEYMAPEQARGERDLDVRADVYAMGCILYHMLAGQLPFSGDSVMVVITKQLSDEPVKPSEVRPDLEIPPPIERICLKAMSKDRELRQASALVFGQDLTAVGAALDAAPFEARTSSQVPDIDSDNAGTTPQPGDRNRGRVMPNSALATGEAVIASVEAPDALRVADEMGRAQTPTAHLAGLRDTPALGDDDDAPTSEAQIDTQEADLPPEEAPPRAPDGSDSAAKTNPVTPLNPTPLLAGEVMDTGETAVYGDGGGIKKLAIAAVLAICVAGGAIWALTGGPPAEADKAAVVSTSKAPATPAAIEPPAPAPPPSAPPDEAAADDADDDQLAAATTAKNKRRPKRKKKRKAKVKTKAADAPVAAVEPPKESAQAPAPPPKPPEPKVAKPKVSKAKALYAKANKAFAKGKHAEAVELYREALVAGYRKAEIHYQLGRAYMRMSKPAKARRQFEAYLKKNPKSPKRKMVEAILKQGK